MHHVKPKVAILFSLVLILLFVFTRHTVQFKSDKLDNDRPLEFSFSNPTVDLTIRVRSSNVSTNQLARQYNLTDLFKIPVRFNKLVTFEQLAGLPIGVWKRAKYPNVYRTYPQDVPLTSIVERIQKGLAVSHMPMYNYPIQLLKTTKSVCTGYDDNDFVMVIKSGVLGWQERESFREFMHNQSLLYPNFKVGYVFSLGLPRKHGGRYFDRDGHRFVLPGQTGDAMAEFLKRPGEAMGRIMQEIETYDDIILGNYEDTYFNLTLKTITDLRWISKFCDKQRHDTFMLIDDDHRVNISMLMHFLNSTSKADKRNSIFGYIYPQAPVIRLTSSKWFVSKSELPWNVYNAYPSGIGLFIGADVIDKMAIATAYTKRSEMPEDAYLGIIVFKLNISMRNESTIYKEDSYKDVQNVETPVMIAKSTYFDAYIRTLRR